MNKLSRLLFNPEKMIKSEDLVNLRGGVRDNPCGDGFDTYVCTIYPFGLSGPMMGNELVCTNHWYPPEPAIEEVYPDVHIVACLDGPN